jgi:hypothetical protein
LFATQPIRAGDTRIIASRSVADRAVKRPRKRRRDAPGSQQPLEQRGPDDRKLEQDAGVSPHRFL